MNISAQLENQIRRHVKELNDLVSFQGKDLTSPEVLNKSMELDLLILKAMRGQAKSFQRNQAC